MRIQEIKFIISNYCLDFSEIRVFSECFFWVVFVNGEFVQSGVLRMTGTEVVAGFAGCCRQLLLQDTCAATVLGSLMTFTTIKDAFPHA